MTERRVPWQAKFVTLALVWGSSFLVMMVALRGWTAFQIVTVRIVLAAATLVGLLVVTRGRLPRGGRVWAHLLVCGFFLAALPFTCFVWSETRIASALAGISNATTPIATVLAVMLMLPSERVTPRRSPLSQRVSPGWCSSPSRGTSPHAPTRQAWRRRSSAVCRMAWDGPTTGASSPAATSAGCRSRRR